MTIKHLSIMVSKYRCNQKTKAVSIRIDSDLLNQVRSQNLNLSSTVNHLLRSYLYIQMVDKSLVFDRLNAKVPAANIIIDVYDSLDI